MGDGSASMAVSQVTSFGAYVLHIGQVRNLCPSIECSSGSTVLMRGAHLIPLVAYMKSIFCRF